VKLDRYFWRASGGEFGEMALSFSANRRWRVLICPALFEEAHRLRHFTVEVMRGLDAAGIDSFLPDLPGLNESRHDLALFDLDDWRAALAAAAQRFEATHVLALRGGGLIVPADLPGWLYGAVIGESLIKTMLRARQLASRESGKAELASTLLLQGEAEGLSLCGYDLPGKMLRQIGQARPAARADLVVLDQARLGGAPLWLRAEAGHDPAQAKALVGAIAGTLAP